MARQEHDREDLLAEATALVERVELSVPGEADPIVIGIRRDGCLSLYFGADPAFHFNTRHELRRAYIGDRLLKAEHGQLVAMTRQRMTGEVQLVRHTLSSEEQAALLRDLSTRIAGLRTRIAAGQGRLLRQIPDDSAWLTRVTGWLIALQGEIRVADIPHAR